LNTTTAQTKGEVAVEEVTPVLSLQSITKEQRSEHIGTADRSRQAGDAPDWVATFGKSQKYPTTKYLLGFGSSIGKDAEASQIAKDNARADLSRTIIVNVKSLLSTVKEEKNQQFSQYLSSITQSSTSIQLMGLQTEQYVDENPINPTTYALSYVSRTELNRIYSKKKSELCNQISGIIADAQSDERKKENAEAITKYLSLYPLYEELKEAETILLVANQSSSIDDAFNELDREIHNLSSGSTETEMMSQIELTNKIDQLLSQSIETVDDVARVTVFQLSKQVSNPPTPAPEEEGRGQVLITPFTYQDTKMSSQFARYFQAALETQLGQMVKWNAVNKTESFLPKSAQITRDLTKSSGAEWLLSGTYWEQGEKIKLLSTMREVNSGKILAGAELLFDSNILKSANLNPKPQNYETALIEQRAFAEDEIINSQLQVDVWTNKGDENLLFIEGEFMKVYIRVNRESHIRLLYILADGRRTVLYDDLYIDQSKINRVVEIPEVFECARPFGAEMLVVVARTEKFEPLDIVEQDGYFFLKAATAKDAAAMTRGMKRRKQEASDIQQTEAKIIITTIEE
jgi:TolB-like protein